MKKGYKILVVGPAWVGDMVMAQSLFKVLQASRPHCQIDVLAPAWSFPLLQRMPEVSQSVEMPLGHGHFGLTQRLRLGRDLQTTGYDQAIVLPNSWKSALAVFFAKIPMRTGYTGEQRWGLLNDIRKLDKQLLSMTVQRFVALAETGQAQKKPHCPQPELLVAEQQVHQVGERFSVNLNKKIIILCPGAEFGPAKRWPSDYFAEVALHSIKQGWQVWLFGSKNELAICEEINQKTGTVCRNFSGLTNMEEAVDLMSFADTVICNDSGLMHVAAALGKNIIALYGSTDPGFTPPLSLQAKILSLELECSPCFQRECPLEHLQCLVGITPDQVIKNIAF